MNSMYADAYRIIGGLSDMKVEFHSVNPQIDQNGKIVCEEHIVEQRVTMSMPLVKEFANTLNSFVKDYESKFGPIMDLAEAKAKLVGNNNNGE